jgi:Rhodopirellula transposase DDE domain
MESFRLSRNSVPHKLQTMDCKATVNLGEFSRGGQTRGENQALDHDFGAEEKYISCEIVDEDSGQCWFQFGSSYKTSDFMVDNLQIWWKGLPKEEPQAETGAQVGEVDQYVLTAVVFDRIPVLTIGGTEDDLEGAF